MKKVRSSQVSISVNCCIELGKTQFFFQLLKIIYLCEMAESLKTIKDKIKKPVKLLQIAENESKRLFERKKKYEIVDRLASFYI